MSTTQNYNPREEVERINKAIEGFNGNEKQLFDIIGRRSYSQLQDLRGEYEKVFNTDITKKLDQSEDKSVVKLVRALFRDHVEYKGETIYNSLVNNNKGEESLINFVIGDSQENVEKTKQQIEKKYNTNLSELVKEHTFGPFKELMIRIVENKRETGILEDKIHSELQLLRHEKKGKWCSDELLNVFARRSPEHLQKLSDRLKECCNVTIGELILNETDGYFQDALLTCSFPREVFWANRIHTALKRCSKDDCLLICCFSQCSKPFLQLVAKEYVETFGINMIEHVKKYTSGNLCVLLLTLLDFPESESDQYKSK